MPAIAQNRLIKRALSSARLSTYELATTVMPRLSGSLALYAWNAQVAAAMLVPLHLCEVIIRNAVSDAIEAEYGAQWPWNSGFERSLSTKGFNMKNELLGARHKKPTTGKVIAELKFVFWEKMLTIRFDERIWNAHLFSVLPNLKSGWDIPTARNKIYSDLAHLRVLRNRIAHHEPIFNRALTVDFQKKLKSSLLFGVIKQPAGWFKTSRPRHCLQASHFKSVCLMKSLKAHFKVG